ncbi:hypothetical protein R6Q57_014801 [Mikania cordata]
MEMILAWGLLQWTSKAPLRLQCLQITNNLPKMASGGLVVGLLVVSNLGSGVGSVRSTFTVEVSTEVRASDDQLCCALEALIIVIDLSGFKVRVNVMGTPIFESISGGGIFGLSCPF